MRRGSRGRGYSRPPHRAQNLNSRLSSDDAMMTNHLLGLKDIDMELELLKRKREIIEQQQQILSNTYRQRNDYEQPVYNQPRDNRYDDYTRLYDNPRQADSFGGGGGGPSGRKRAHVAVWENDHGGGRGGSSNRKRPHFPVWENESPPKRFSVPSRGGKKGFVSRPLQQSSSPDCQSLPAIPPRPKRPERFAPPQKKKEFNPTKVTKYTAIPPLMKLNSYQPAERKKLVTGALANSTVTRVKPTSDDTWTLRADCEPSRQMLGRMELALGSIMSDLREQFPEFIDLFKVPSATRAMKQAVRERIRTALMGKVIKNSVVIKHAYYDMFPSTTANDIVLKGLESQKGSEFITIEADDPEVYFKKNMYRLMTLKMEEMTKKLEEIYCGGTSSLPRKRNDKNFANLNNQSQPTADLEKSSDVPAVDLTQADNVQPEVGEAVQSNEGEPAVQSNEDEAIQLNKNEDQSKPDDTTQAVDNQPNTEKPVADNDVTNIVTSEVSTEKAPDKVVNSDFVNLDQYKAFERLMDSKMIHLIKKFTPAFVKNMNADVMYRKAKAAIMNETSKKLGAKKPEEAPPQAPQNTHTTKPPNETRFLTPLQYYVKIIGKPYLPKRKAMEAFFEEFKPKSVKKHRTLYNLLFVGFADKEPYEKILAANGTVIGRYTLEIKVSERSDKKNPNQSTSSVVSLDSSKATEPGLNDSGSEILGVDLDEQITDLLTSIRKAEELENFSDDVVIDEPRTTDNKNDMKIQDGEEPEAEPTVVLDTASGDEKKETLETDDDDVVEVKDVAVLFDDADIVEIKDDVEEGNNGEVKPAEEAVQQEDGEAGNNGEVKPAEEAVQQEDEEAKIVATNEEAEKQDTVQALKTEANIKATPTRASARLAAPGGIRTRRMSKLE